MTFEYEPMHVEYKVKYASNMVRTGTTIKRYRDLIEARAELGKQYPLAVELTVTFPEQGTN